MTKILQLENIRNYNLNKNIQIDKMKEYLNKQFSKEDIQVDNEHVRKCSASVHYAEEQKFPIICCEYNILQPFSKTLCEFLIKLSMYLLSYQLGLGFQYLNLGTHDWSIQTQRNIGFAKKYKCVDSEEHNSYQMQN